MQGLELSERFYRASVDELFEGMDDVRARHAAGLAGEGSECFGFDDAFSQDHDWGPAFCIWLDDEDYWTYGSELQHRYDTLAARGFEGFAPRMETAQAALARRIGILRIDDFFERLLGADLPHTLGEWRAIPESGLAAATNGRVFEDGLGRFTRMREQLAGYYPEDVRLRKIASGCMHAAQAGQYNFIRQSQRGEDVAAFLALGEFVDAVEQIVFALERCYRPFYKWAHRKMKDLGALGADTARRLDQLLAAYRGENWQIAAQLIEETCANLAMALRAQGLSQNSDTFLIPHGIEVNSRIVDDAYRRTDLMQL